ncbi:MAG: EAL domain-containing protein [Azonexus sp.]|nr:EAL domain-containing protein [Azonexus sp.]
MPLTDLIRYFNVADSSEHSSLYLEGERAAAWHNGLRLGSLFQPIVDLRRERVVGHQATLKAQREDGTPVSTEEAYALCPTAESVIHFDRLSRTLHALNFLAQRRHAGGYLQLAVHPRHLKAVQSQHGLVYEAILKRCGLGPEDIVLDIDADEFQHNPYLGDALNNYRQRGYRLALCESGIQAGNTKLLALRPDILKLRLTEGNMLAEIVRSDGIAIELTGIDSGQDFRRANAVGADLGQGKLFGRPQSDCQPTHSSHGVAYNPHNPSGASP